MVLLLFEFVVWVFFKIIIISGIYCVLAELNKTEQAHQKQKQEYVNKKYVQTESKPDLSILHE